MPTSFKSFCKISQRSILYIYRSKKTLRANSHQEVYAPYFNLHFSNEDKREICVAKFFDATSVTIWYLFNPIQKFLFKKIHYLLNSKAKSLIIFAIYIAFKVCFKAASFILASLENHYIITLIQNFITGSRILRKYRILYWDFFSFCWDLGQFESPNEPYFYWKNMKDLS